MVVCLFHLPTAHSAVLDWDAAGVDWPTTPPPASVQDFGPVTFYNVDNSGMDIRITITQNGGLVGSSAPGSPTDSDYVTGGNSSGQASNLFLRQLTTSPTASSVVKVEFLGGTASDITVNAFGIDSYPDPKKISSWRDWVKVTASDGTSTFDPSSITTSVANEIPHNSQIQWFNNNFPGAGVAQTNVVRGLSEVTDTSADGNAEFAFAQTGITELEIEYWNSWEEEHPHNTNSEQWIGLLNRMEFTATLVPEPSTYASLLVGLLCAAGVAWYRKKHLAAA